MNRRLVLIVSIIATLGLATVAAGQIAQTARVDPAKIDQIFASVANTKSPGCVAATIRDGKIEFARGYGMADIARGVPITPTTAFNLGSVTKQFTAAAINLLVAEGRLSLDDDVKKYVPELPSYEAPITIRHLVNHTSGLRNFDALFDLAGESQHGISQKAMLEMLARQRRLNFTPGKQFAYSNSGYALLAVIVERVSGKPLSAFADERFFRPLGMAATVFRDRSDAPIKNRALGYALENGKWRDVTPDAGTVGHGGLYSTVEDLARWQHQMEEPRVGGTKWRALTEERGRLDDGTTLLYGAGLLHYTLGSEATIEHAGGSQGSTAQLMRFPRLGLSIAVLCNGVSPQAQNFARRVATLYVGPGPAPASPPPVAPTATLAPQEMARYTGIFFNERVPFNGVRQIVVDSGKLFYVRGRDDRTEITPLGASRFKMAGLTFSLRPDTLAFDPPSFQAPYLPSVSGGATLVRVGTAKRDLRDYAGRYVSDELPARWTVQVADTGLVVKRDRGAPYRLTRAFEDGFQTPGAPMIARFIRDHTGEVTAMEFSAGDRAWHVRFERQSARDARY